MVSRDTLKGMQTEARIQYLIPEPGHVILGNDEGIEQIEATGEGRLVRGAEFDALVPGPGEVVVGGANGPVAVEKDAMRGPVHTENINAQTLAKWRRALARVRAGVADARILCVGDSTTWGSHGGTVHLDSYPARLAAMLDRSFVPAGQGIQVPSIDTHVPSQDARWTMGAGWSRVLDWGFAGRHAMLNNNAAATEPLTFAPGIPCDTFRIWYQTNTSLGTLQISIDGGAPVAQPTAGAADWLYRDITTTLASNHVVSITATGATVVVIGIEAWDASEKRVLVGRAGIPGTTTGQWAYTPVAGRQQAVEAYGADLTIINLGINDSRTTNNVPVATYKANIKVLIEQGLIHGDVLLTTFVPSLTTFASPALQASYWDVLRELSQEYDIGLVDIAARLGTADEQFALGLASADKVHPTNLGYADMASAVYAAITAV